MFPDARKHLPPQMFAQLGEEMKERKEVLKGEVRRPNRRATIEEARLFLAADSPRVTGYCVGG